MKKNIFTLIGIGLITGALMWTLVQASGVSINRTPSISDDGTTVSLLSTGPNVIGTTGAQDLRFQTNSANRWEIDGEGNGGAGSLIPITDDSHDVGSSARSVREIFVLKVARRRTATALGVAATTFAATTDYHNVTGDAGTNTIATITGGRQGRIMLLTFVDSLVTITDDNTHAANSVDLSAAFTSADDTTLTLLNDGVSWYEISRSVN